MFTIEYVKNLQWGNEEKTFFSCLVKYKEFNDEHPSGINSIDQYPHIKEIWEKGTAGEYGEILKYEPPQACKNPEPAPQEEQPQSQGTQTL